MGSIEGTKDYPVYITDNGVRLELRAIRALVVDRWRIEWNKQHPKPMPPVIQLSNGDDWYDANDAWYQELLAEYDQERSNALAEFLFSRGVLNEPPKDWQPILEVNGAQPRYAWVSEILTNDDIEQLMNAIMGIDNPTEQGVEDAEKKSVPVGEDSP